MSDIRIFISTHKENIRIPENALVYPVQVGTALRDNRFLNMLHDDEGENISDKNRSYCELTGQYWVWKNVEADYYGFMHYRRYLSFAEEKFPTVHEPFIFDEVVFPDNSEEYLKRISFDEGSMRKTIEEYDFLVPQASYSLSGETVYEQYANSAGHHIEDLDSVISYIRQKYPEIVPAMDTYFRGRKLFCCNMFIMKKELFFSYCSWLFDILEEFENRRDLSTYPPVDGRVTGYLAERLCGVYITYLFSSEYRGIELQKVYFRETDPTIPSVAEKNSNIKDVFNLPKTIVKKAGHSGKSLAKRGARKVYGKIKTRFGSVPVYSRHREDLLSPGSLDTSIIRAITDIDGRIILQFSIKEVLEKSNREFDHLEIHVTDKNSKSILFSEMVKLREKLIPVERFPEYICKVSDFSCKLAALPGSFDIVVGKGSNIYTTEFTDKAVADSLKLWNNCSKSVSYYTGYNDWYIKEHKVKNNELIYQRSHRFNIEPMYSIIVPLYKTPLDYLKQMIESVLSQTYGKFELVLVCASPEDDKISDVLEKYKKNDSRIKLKTLEKNLGITENTNAGIEIASGDFLCFLDHDDILEPDALFEYTAAINHRPDTDLLYCDEDKICDGMYTDPYFKPDYDPDLLMGINYVCHFLAVRKSIVDTLKPADSVYDGAQDYHMTFRVAEKSRYINHVSRILYHWRIHDNSTASDPEQKSYTLEAARLCVEGHLQRCGIDAKAVNSFRVPRHYEVIYELPEKKPLVSIIIPNRDNFDKLKKCIDSIVLKSTYDNYEIIIVDNNSTDDKVIGYYDQIRGRGFIQTDEVNEESCGITESDPNKRNEKIRIVEFNEEFNFAKEINTGTRESNGEYLIFLNNDTEVLTNDWIEKMLGPCMRPEMGVVGPKLLFPDGTVQHAGIVINENGPMHLNQHLPRFASGYYDTARLSMNVSAVTGACMMTKRCLFDDVGGMNELLKVDYNDVDYCLKLRDKGYLVLYEAGVELYHYESASRDDMDADDSLTASYCIGQGYLMQTWSSYYTDGDPYFNRNFAKNSTYYCVV